MNPLLSICIPTYNRAGFLRECLDAFVPLVAPHRIPIYVSDNGSTDGTVAMLEEYQRSTYPLLSFRSQKENRGIDQNMVDVLTMASSRYAWLFGDDDLPRPGAVERVLECLHDDYKLIVINASTHNADMTQLVEERRIKTFQDQEYDSGDHNRLLVDVASYITYLGGLVVDLTAWRSIDHSAFLNTDYLHVSVALRFVVGHRAFLCAEPLVRIRLQPPSWLSRYFEVEMVNWPRTVWALSEDDYTAESKQAVVDERPTAVVRRVAAMRGYGHYDRATYQKFIAQDHSIGAWRKLLMHVIAAVPPIWFRGAFIAYLRGRQLLGSTNHDLALFRLGQARRQDGPAIAG